MQLSDYLCWIIKVDNISTMGLTCRKTGLYSAEDMHDTKYMYMYMNLKKSQRLGSHCAFYT